MSGKNTYQQQDQIRRYLQDQMTDQERHAFERKMQRDAFLAEAVEGYSKLATEQIYTDLAELKNRINKQNTVSRKYIWYAAASVLVLLISTFILFNLEEKSNPMVSENKIEQEVAPKEELRSEKKEIIENEKTDIKISIPKKEIILEVEDELEISETTIEPSLVAANKTESSFSQPLAEQVMKSISFQAPEDMKFSKAAKVNADTITTALIANDSSKSQVVIRGVSSMGKQKKAESVSNLKNGPDTSESGIFISGQNRVRMNEIEILSNDTALQQTFSGTVAGVAVSPIDGEAMPFIGWEAFYKLINIELQEPGIGSPKEKTIVRLSFMVTETGAVKEFKILKGINKEFNQEAIRIIKDGPAWKPEVKDGKLFRSVIKMRLVFLPSK